MAGEEFRSYTISGELHPQHWETLLKQLGALGVAGEAVRLPLELADGGMSDGGAQEKREARPDALLNRGDFWEFADNNGHSRMAAGQAWNSLASLYIYNHYPDQFSMREWFKAEDYRDVPLVFENVPFHVEWPYFNNVSDLRLSSLEELLDWVDKKTKELSNFRLKGVYGKKVGPKAMQLMRDLAAAKRAEIEAGQA